MQAILQQFSKESLDFYREFCYLEMDHTPILLKSETYRKYFDYVRMCTPFLSPLINCLIRMEKF